jgi:hypothetical protein
MLSAYTKFLYKVIPNGKARWFIAFIAPAVLSAASFITINTPLADRNNINGLLSITGVVFAALTVIFGIAASKESAEQDDKGQFRKGR